MGKKIKKAIEKHDQQRRREEQKAIKKGALDPSQTRPTLPKIGGSDDDSSITLSLQRSDTVSTTTTLPPYSVNAPSRTNTMSTNTSRNMSRPSLPVLSERPDMPTRSNTQGTNFSTTSYGSNAPLLNQAGGMGRSSPAPPMPPLDRNGDYFSEQPRPYGSSGRPYSPMSQGRNSPRPPRGPLPPVDTSYSNGRYESDPQLISPLPSDLRGPPSAQSSRPYPEFSPFDSRGPQMGPAYELSPVDMTPSDNMSRHYYSNSDVLDEYQQPPQIPSALRAGSPAMSQPVGLPSQPRAGTAPPRPGLPASLQSAIQRREASQPLPNRGMNGSVQQQRSATAPIQQPSWNQGAPAPRSYTPSAPAPRGYDNSYGY